MERFPARSPRAAAGRVFEPDLHRRITFLQHLLTPGTERPAHPGVSRRSPGGLQGVQGVPGTELRVPGPSATSRVAVCKESVSLLSGTRCFRGLLLELVAVCLSWLLTALSRVLWLSAWSATALHAVGGNSKLLRVVGPCFCFDTYNLIVRWREGEGVVDTWIFD